MRLDPAHFRHAVGNFAPRWPFGIDRASPQARGLAASWPLFAGPDFGLRDLSDNGADLALGASTAAPAWIATAAFNCHALDFDGVNDEAHVAAGNVAALAITGNQITLSAWVRPDTTGNSNGLRVISKRTDAGGTDIYAIFNLDTGSSPQIWFRLNAGGSTTNLSVSVADTTGTWQLWTATYDGANMRLYRNGIRIGTQPKTGNIGSSARAVYLGHREAEARHFNGAMADVRIYDRCLSGREVFALYDPATRWDLFREVRVPRVWPKAAAGGGGPVLAAASLGGAAALSAAGGSTRLAGAVLAGEANLALAAGAARRAAAALLGEGQLQAVATVARGAAGGLIAEADLVATAGGAQATAGAVLAGEASLALAAGAAQATAAVVAGEAALALVPAGGVLALVALTGEAALSAKAASAGAAASLAGEGALVPLGTVSRTAALKILASSGLSATASVGANAAAALIGEAMLSGSVVTIVPGPARALILISDRAATEIEVTDRAATRIDVYDRAS